MNRKYFYLITILLIAVCLLPLASLTGLTELGLKICPKIDDISSLSSLTGLKELTLWNLGASCDLSPLESLKELTYLDVRPLDELTSFRSFTSLTKLTKLTIRSCDNFTDFYSLSVFPNLTSLKIESDEFPEYRRPTQRIRTLPSNIPVTYWAELANLYINDVTYSFYSGGDVYVNHIIYSP